MVTGVYGVTMVLGVGDEDEVGETAMQNTGASRLTSGNRAGAPMWCTGPA